MSDSRDTLLQNAVKAHEAPHAALAAYAHEKSLWVNGSSQTDSFYHLEPTPVAASPGSLLKREHVRDPGWFALPPGLALSRIAYQSEYLSGRSVPATCFLLWPFCPRIAPQDGKTALAVWAYGTSGIFAESAPSHLFDLAQHFLGPFPLALNGYAVFAPDYAGLGIDVDQSSQRIRHAYPGHQARANDIVFGVQAARQVFAELSEYFIVIGHSRGGGAAWGVAQRQVERPVEGNLGAVSVCPVTDVLKLRNYDNPLITCLGAFTLPVIKSLYPDFSPDEVLTRKGLARFKLYKQIQGSIPSGVALLCGDFDLIKPDWQQNPTVRKYIEHTRTGGKSIAGPLLVMQGEQDPNMSCSVTEEAVQQTMDRYLSAQLEYVRLPGTGHNDTMYASQPLWLDWIAKRSGETDAASPSATLRHQPGAFYQKAAMWHVAKPTSPWQTM